MDIYPIVLYKGVGTICGVYDVTAEDDASFSLSGNATVANDVITVTGDCTITTE